MVFDSILDVFSQLCCGSVKVPAVVDCNKYWTGCSAFQSIERQRNHWYRAKIISPEVTKHSNNLKLCVFRVYFCCHYWLKSVCSAIGLEISVGICCPVDLHRTDRDWKIVYCQWGNVSTILTLDAWVDLWWMRFYRRKFIKIILEERKRGPAGSRTTFSQPRFALLFCLDSVALGPLSTVGPFLEVLLSEGQKWVNFSKGSEPKATWYMGKKVSVSFAVPH